ncbi:hypothetical protein [Nocardia lijiangensis]|uniref:hypothetical protein n=1 Tax=Nocardia lijiangensis TaxID=299618 RepID=UPI003D75FC4A
MSLRLLCSPTTLRRRDDAARWVARAAPPSSNGSPASRACSTEIARERYESAARANLQRELDALAQLPH